MTSSNVVTLISVIIAVACFGLALYMGIQNKPQVTKTKNKNCFTNLVDELKAVQEKAALRFEILHSRVKPGWRNGNVYHSTNRDPYYEDIYNSLLVDETERPNAICSFQVDKELGGIVSNSAISPWLHMPCPNLTETVLARFRVFIESNKGAMAYKLKTYIAAGYFHIELEINHKVLIFSDAAAYFWYTGPLTERPESLGHKLSVYGPKPNSGGETVIEMDYITWIVNNDLPAKLIKGESIAVMKQQESKTVVSYQDHYRSLSELSQGNP